MDTEYKGKEKYQYWAVLFKLGEDKMAAISKAVKLILSAAFIYQNIVIQIPFKGVEIMFGLL